MGATHLIQSQMDRHGIMLQAYSPLGAGTTGKPRTPELITGDLVTSIGAKYGKSGAQVSLRWLVQKGVPIAAESTSKAHLASDVDIFDFELSPDDMAALDAVDDGSATAYVEALCQTSPVREHWLREWPVGSMGTKQARIERQPPRGTTR